MQDYFAVSEGKPYMDWDRLFTAVLGSVITLLIQGLYRWWHRPRLAVTFLESRPGYKVFTSEERPNPLAGSTGYSSDAIETYKAMYVSISVKNEGNRIAQHCRGFLVGIDVKGNGGRWEPTDYCDSVPLAWSYRSDADAHHGIDIPQGVDQFLNVLSVRQPGVDQGFRPATIPKTLRFAARHRFKEPGEFRFRIQIAADEIPTQVFGLYVRWEGVWNDDLWKNLGSTVQICECTDTL